MESLKLQIGRPATIRCRLPDLLREFIDWAPTFLTSYPCPAPDEPDAAGFMYFKIPGADIFRLVSVRSRIPEYPAPSSDLRELSQPALVVTAMRDLLEVVSNAKRDVARFGLYAEVREHHLPALKRYSARWVVESGSLSNPFVTPWTEVRLTGIGDETNVARVERPVPTRTYVFPGTECVGIVWALDPNNDSPTIPPHLVSNPLLRQALTSLTERSTFQPFRYDSSVCLPFPYNIIVGAVCRAGLNWLGDLEAPHQRRCQACGEFLPEDSSINRRYCGESCRSAHRRQKRRIPTA